MKSRVIASNIHVFHFTVTNRRIFVYDLYFTKINNCMLEKHLVSNEVSISFLANNVDTLTSGHISRLNL